MYCVCFFNKDWTILFNEGDVRPLSRPCAADPQADGGGAHLFGGALHAAPGGQLLGAGRAAHHPRPGDESAGKSGGGESNDRNCRR